MSDITVKITVTAPNLHAEREETIHIPETYAESDTRILTGHSVEQIGARLLREHAFPTPYREAFLGNAARLSRLEELVNEFFADHSISSSVLDRLRELYVVDAPEAIRRWGEPVIEVDEDETDDDTDV